LWGGRQCAWCVNASSAWEVVASGTSLGDRQHLRRGRQWCLVGWSSAAAA
jgi:hypothetical protein